MRFRFPRPRDLAIALRELARRHPDEAEDYLDSHQDAWVQVADLHPHEAADILEALPEEGAADLISELQPEGAADILDEMRPGPAADLVERLTPEQAATLITEMTADQAADLLGELEDEFRDAIIGVLDEAEAAEALRLLAYPADTAGGLMTGDVASIPVGITAGEAVEALRRIHETLGSSMSYVYVVDDDERLVGVISFRDLFFARPGTGLDVAMVPNPVRVKADTDREVVAELIQRYHLLAIPVVDDADRLIGMVKIDEAMGAVQEEASEDIAAMVGAGAEETVFTPVAVSVRRRLPWILVNLGIGLGIAFVIRPFEDLIADKKILAALMPMVALVGGNSGAQSLAVVIRAMAVGDIPSQRAPRVIAREMAVAIVNGIAISVAAAVAGGLIAGELEVGIIIGVAVLANLVVAGLAGSGIPILLRRLGQDPALASNIFLTMITDIVGFGGFLVTATILL